MKEPSSYEQTGAVLASNRHPWPGWGFAPPDGREDGPGRPLPTVWILRATAWGVLHAVGCVKNVTPQRGGFRPIGWLHRDYAGWCGKQTRWPGWINCEWAFPGVAGRRVGSHTWSRTVSNPK